MTLFPGKLVIISGPSGTGKSSVVARLLRSCPLPLQLSVSATTRPPRANEVNGIHYEFLTVEEFHARRKAGTFLETFEVFGRGTWYGTPLEPVTSGLREGKWIILEIDVHGAKQAVERFPTAITIFVHPGSLAKLESRLRGRNSESEDQVQRRLEVAREEMEYASWYQHLVVNQDIEQTAQDICQLLKTQQSEPSPCMTN